MCSWELGNDLWIRNGPIQSPLPALVIMITSKHHSNSKQMKPKPLPLRRLLKTYLRMLKRAMHSQNGDDRVEEASSSSPYYVHQWGGYAKSPLPLSRPLCVPKYDANWVRMRSIPTRRRVKSKYFHHHLGSKLMAIKFWVKFFSSLF